MKQILLTVALIFSINFAYSQIANQPPDIQICDDNYPDGFSTFDLTIVSAAILGGQNPNDFSVTYHTSTTDANNGVNAIPYPYSFFNTSNPQTIYARVTENSTGNYDTTNFMIEVLPTPLVFTPSPLETCDVDLDGFTVFDLESTSQEILNNLPNATISYYETLSGAEAQYNQIINTSSYTNLIAYYQTIWIRVSLSSPCSTIVPLELIAIDCTYSDSDSDGVTDLDEDLNSNGNLNDDDTDLDGMANYLDNDDDDDGVLTIDEDYNGNGDPTDDDTDSSGVPDYLEMNVALNIAEFTFSDLRVYPNPSSETIYIDNMTNQANISIYDIRGRQINVIIQRATNSRVEFDISSLNNGIYIMKIQNDSWEKSLKFVVKNN